MKYRIMVRVSGETSYNGNGLRFDTEQEAATYAEKLANRWLAVTHWRVDEVAEDAA